MFVFILILANECTALKMPLRIYGGVDAKSGEYQYVVRIEMQRLVNYKNNTIIPYSTFLCSASALSPVWVLSAAHCLKPRRRRNKTVIRYGNMEDPPWIKESFSEVLFTVMHPLYNVRGINFGGATNHDIGLLKTSPMSIMSYMKLSAVDYKSLYGHEAIIAGFGITTKTNAEGKIEKNDTLSLKKPLQLLEILVSKCWEGRPYVPNFCVSARCIDVTTVCPGDSGGPVIHASGLIGIVSKGKGTGYCFPNLEEKRVNIAAIVVTVSPYIEWILSYVNV